ncbi:SpoIIIAC/SpoIIIAD family protein [Sporosarcina oncorhynchi]|uniref:SpoIIIAC/SpoIIIAD family protein n=1 Tax=Sporosarcina oncorhynchi TaxID=3056444 RepID=A0ABZ0L9D1_9BACL|nr:hypothetical protein [Sporosarcina sp. T2O-4]WOV88877.1 SpoIIIAC/SpoIIIAD family protein [Sporosarcina sp. T2O-4]
MAVTGHLMATIFQLIVVYLLLLLVTFASKSLQPIIYAALFFIFLSYVSVLLIIPFGSTLIDMFAPLPSPYVKLIIGSVFLFYVSELIVNHISEAGYGSISAIAQIAVKIAVITLWLPHLSQMIETLSRLIIK